MKAAGLSGVRRGKRFVTTKPDGAAARPPDLVQRDFTAERPNLLWLVDFTYVPTWSGMAFTAFVHDGEFKWSSQHRPVRVTVGARSGPRRGCASRGSFGVCC